MRYSESNEEYEKQVLALQKENNYAQVKLRESEDKIIEMNRKIVDIETDNFVINELQSQIDKYESEVMDKNKVSLSC